MKWGLFLLMNYRETANVKRECLANFKINSQVYATPNFLQIADCNHKSRI